MKREVIDMKVHLTPGLFLLLLTLTAACATAPKKEMPEDEVYTQPDVWTGSSGKYDVTVRIKHKHQAGRWRCSQRVIEMKPSPGLHNQAWGYVEAYDYDCDNRFDRLRFRYPEDRRRAATAQERFRLIDELWFAFGKVVPIEEQMP